MGEQRAARAHLADVLIAATDVAAGEPEIAVWAGGDAISPTGDGEFGVGAGGRDATDAALFGEPEIAVRPGGDEVGEAPLRRI
jgi:hypothetical protein